MLMIKRRKRTPAHTKKKTPPLPKQLFPVFLQRALIGMSMYSSAIQKVCECRKCDCTTHVPRLLTLHLMML